MKIILDISLLTQLGFLSGAFAFAFGEAFDGLPNRWTSVCY
jgi:hypothetical protein